MNQPYASYLTLEVNGQQVQALLDSGNLWKNVISEDFYKHSKLGPLVPCRSAKVGTAKKGADMTALGTVEMELSLPTGHTCRTDAVVIKGLSMDLNLSGPFMRSQGWDQIHSRGMLRVNGCDVPLTGKSPAWPCAYVNRKTLIPGRSFTKIPLRFDFGRNEPRKSGLYVLRGSNRFMDTTDLHPGVQALVQYETGQEEVTAAVLNSLDQPVTLDMGTFYGHAEPASRDDDDDPAAVWVVTLHEETEKPLSRKEKRAKYIREFVAQARENAERKRKGEEEVPDQSWDEDKKREWLTTYFKLRQKPCIQGEPGHLRAAQDLLLKFFGFFSFDGSFGETHLMEHRIITEDVPPIKCKYRPVNPALEPDLRKQLDEWLKHDVIEPSESPWSSNLVAAKKKGGRLRWCIDWRALNKVTKKDSFPMPSITDNLTRLAGSTIFSSVDMTGAFHSIPLAKEDREKTAFSTPFGLFQNKRLGFGLTNGPSAYCRLVEMILREIPPSMAVGFLDDAVIHSTTFAEHLHHLDKTLATYQRAGLRLSPSKCQFFCSEVEYLGHLISAEGVRPTEGHVRAILDWPMPTFKTEARGFLGAAGYYSSHIKDYAKLAAPWFGVIGKTTPEEEKKKLTITPDMEESFKAIKRALTSYPVLGFPYFKGPKAGQFILDTDFSASQIAGILSQNQQGTEVVIAYGSKKLNSSQKNYPSTKGELFAGIHFMDKYRYYLQFGQKFLWRTDNKALRSVHTMKPPSSIIMRWLETLADFDFEVQHRAGKKHRNADAVSRFAAAAEEADEEEPQIATMVRQGKLLPLEKPDLYKAQREDPVINRVIQWIEQGKGPEGQAQQQLGGRLKFYAGALPKLSMGLDGLLYFATTHPLYRRPRQLLVLPNNLLRMALEAAHDQGGHMGINTTTNRIKHVVHYPGLTKEVATYVATCTSCQAKGRQEPPQRHTLVPTASGFPFQRIHIDFVGPMTPGKLTGAKWLLTIKDVFSKWVEAVPLKQATAEAAARALEDTIFCRFGYPEQIHSDQGSQFTSRLFQEVCSYLNIRKTTTPPYHPCSNGQVERVHRDLAKMLRALCHHDDGDWEELLPQALLALRTAVNRTTGLAPFQVVFGRDVSSPLELIFGHPNGLITTDGSDARHYVRKLQERVEETQAFVLKNISEAVRRQRRSYNKEKKLFLPGTKVWVFTPPIADGKPNKLKHMFTGPWTVCASPDNTEVFVRVAPDPSWNPEGCSKIVPIDRLKLYKGTEHRPPSYSQEPENPADDCAEFIPLDNHRTNSQELDSDTESDDDDFHGFGGGGGGHGGDDDDGNGGNDGGGGAGGAGGGDQDNGHQALPDPQEGEPPPADPPPAPPPAPPPPQPPAELPPEEAPPPPEQQDMAQAQGPPVQPQQQPPPQLQFQEMPPRHNLQQHQVWDEATGEWRPSPGRAQARARSPPSTPRGGARPKTHHRPDKPRRRQEGQGQLLDQPFQPQHRLARTPPPQAPQDSLQRSAERMARRFQQAADEIRRQDPQQATPPHLRGDLVPWQDRPLSRRDQRQEDARIFRESRPRRDRRQPERLQDFDMDTLSSDS